MGPRFRGDDDLESYVPNPAFSRSANFASALAQRYRRPPSIKKGGLDARRLDENDF
jgi:hypothetical protein